MFDGYLELGGSEILNSARALAYAETASCGVSWFKCPPCDGIADAVGDEPYDYADIEAAPWYDAEYEPSHRFLGAHAITIEGMRDSTRTAEVSETLGDGGVVGRVRHAVKRVRVRALLTGQGQDGLEAGLSWLKSALDPAECGMHGSSCGAADACFFAACPPTLAETTVSEDVWTLTRRNETPNPRFITNAQWSLPAATGVWAGDGTVDVSGTAGDASPLAYETTAIPVLPGEVWTVSRLFTVPAGRPEMQVYLAVVPYAGASGAAGTVNSPVVTIQPGQSARLSVTSAALGPTVTGLRSFAYTAGAAVAGRRVVMTEAMVEKTGAVGSYFDGATPDTDSPMFRYGWVGAAYASPSTAEQGVVVETPDEEAHEAAVDTLLRRLHNVTCISGPIIEQTLHRGDAWGYIVEFVLAAGTPWVFGDTRQLAIQPSMPVVVQDVPFNLVPYPSAELTSGTVVVSTNYATNPSVESNITGWAASTDGVKILPARVAIAASNELASVGLQSAKATFTANTTDVSGTFGAEQLVQLPGITATSRYSVNVWAVANVQSGTAVLSGIEFHAYWQNGAGAVLRDDLLGTLPASGGAMSVRSILPPAGTTRVVVRARAMLTSWSTGAIVRLYADALAVTVP